MRRPSRACIVGRPRARGVRGLEKLPKRATFGVPPDSGRRPSAKEPSARTLPFVRTRIATAVAATAFALGGGVAHGAGFALQENSGSGLGNAYAGGAAAAEDAATLWSNVAGMSKIKTNQIVAAVNFIFPSFKFSDGG